MELIIAMGVIIVGLLTVVGLITRSISLGALSKNEIIALSLAQEGIEAVRAIRDTNSLKIESGMFNAERWDDNLERDLGTGQFDYTGMPLVSYDFSNPLNLIESVWIMDFGSGTTQIDSLDDERTAVLRYADDHADFPGLFFQSPDSPQSGVSIDTGFRRLVTLEPICDVGGTPTILSGVETVNSLSAAPACSSTKIGIRIVSTVRWQDQIKREAQIISVTQDVYDWR